MRNNNSGTGLAVVMVIGVLLVIGWIGNAMEPKCIKSGCDNSRAEGSSYCYLHKGSSYDYTYRYAGSSSSSNSSSSSGSKSSSSSSGSSKSTSTASKSTSGSKKPASKYSGWDSYDAGYEDIYDNDDYDWDRYDRDSDYADGVDDAMDELGGDW